MASRHSLDLCKVIHECDKYSVATAPDRPTRRVSQTPERADFTRVSRNDVSPEEYRSVVRAQLVLAAVAVVSFFAGTALFGQWGGIGAIAVVVALALGWRNRHLATVRRLERRNRDEDSSG